MAATVAWIGLGGMGTGALKREPLCFAHASCDRQSQDNLVSSVVAMSTRLHQGLAAGIPGFPSALTVHNRTLSKTKALADVGAAVAESIHDLGDARVVFTISANDASAEQVQKLRVEGHTDEHCGHRIWLRSLALLVMGYALNSTPSLPCQIFGAWLEAATGDQIYVECSTILPETARALAARAAAKGVAYISGPVFGRPDAAAAGQLTGLLAGGTKAARDRIRPLVASYAGPAVLDLGDDPGAANALKLSGKYEFVLLWGVVNGWMMNSFRPISCMASAPANTQSNRTPPPSPSLQLPHWSAD